jgi:hypothetical protein
MKQTNFYFFMETSPKNFFANCTNFKPPCHWSPHFPQPLSPLLEKDPPDLRLCPYLPFFKFWFVERFEGFKFWFSACIWDGGRHQISLPQRGRCRAKPRRMRRSLHPVCWDILIRTNFVCT